MFWYWGPRFETSFPRHGLAAKQHALIPLLLNLTTRPVPSRLVLSVTEQIAASLCISWANTFHWQMIVSAYPGSSTDTVNRTGLHHHGT